MSLRAPEPSPYVPCPACGRRELSSTAIHALQNVLDALERGHISIGRFQDYVNAAIRGCDDHDVAFTLTDRIARQVRLGPGRTAEQIADALGLDEVKQIRSLLSRLRRRRVLVHDASAPVRWYPNTLEGLASLERGRRKGYAKAGGKGGGA